MDMRVAEALTSYNGHDAECLCVRCMMADLDNHILTTRGEAALTRIDLATQTDKATVKPERTRNLRAGQRVGRGVVRTISIPQVNLIKKLIAERDTSGIVLLPGQTLNPTEVPNMGVKGGSALIDKLFKCPMITPNDSVRKDITGSPRQIEWLTKGINGKPSLFESKGILTESDVNTMLGTYNHSAKKIIDHLLTLPDIQITKAKEELSKAHNDKEFIPTAIIPGYYRDKESIEWKVQFNQSKTGMYALRRDGKKKYTFVSGAIKTLTPEMFVSLNPLDITLEQAKAHGRKTGNCYMCGRQLTNPTSVKEGIGPICADKF